MKLHSIKFKITCWYTLIILFLFSIVLGGAFFASEIYSESNIKEELEDEVKDLQEEIDRYQNHFPQEDISSYYDDGIMLSIYNDSSDKIEFINGIIPDIFPEDVPFTDDIYQNIEDGDDSWFIYDKRMELKNGMILWIRGVYSISPLVIMIHSLAQWLSFGVPALIILTAFVGYRMISHSLKPITEINATVDEIIKSSDLSLRLERPATKDEFYNLTETFNNLLNHLEVQFIHEQQFSSDAAHELRTPVCAILAHTEYCLEEMELSEELRAEMESIHQKTLRMSDLISNLLVIARAENDRYTPVFEEVDLEILAESVIDELHEKAAEKNIHLEIHNSMKPPVIQADMDMMMRLFINIISNSINYGHQHGYVKINIYKTNNQACLEFTDNGIGIPPEKINKIWDRFFQADPSHSSEGFGLGLFMVKYIVNCHKGTIDVKSEFGRGTTFTIHLPLNQSI